VIALATAGLLLVAAGVAAGATGSASQSSVKAPPGGSAQAPATPGTAAPGSPAPASATPASSAPGTAAKPGTKPKPPEPKPVDINHASREQLKTLPGIGDAEASRIIAGRPYYSKAQLATKGVLPEGVYHAIRKRVVADQTGIPPPTK
jgi:DNA uptake protein ComE-like DNA-binding protein